MEQHQIAQPIHVGDLLAAERRSLLDLLSGLEPGDWGRPTECPAWTVTGICLHLLGDDLSLLSRQRDEQPSPVVLAADAQGWDQLFSLLDRFNEAWVDAASFLSAGLLHQLLALSGEWSHTWYTTVNPDRLGEPVPWAGPEPAPYWLLAGREYLERWIHQQQIRRAVGAVPLDDPHWVLPAVGLASRGFPAGLAALSAPSGTMISLSLPGAGWTAQRDGDVWQLYDGIPEEPTVRLSMEVGDAALLFSRGLRTGDVAERILLHGERGLGSSFVAGLGAFFGRP
jgi:uncharacterized protein (TIGR03083 family)